MESNFGKYVNWILPFFLGIGVYVLLYVSSNFEDEIFSWQAPVFFIIFTAIILWIVNAYLKKIFKEKEFSTVGFVHFIIALLISVSIYMLSYIGFKSILIVVDNQADSIDLRHLTLAGAQSLIMSVIVVGAQFIILGSKAWSENRIQSERLLKENVESKLANLKMQLSPHFLFNSFNALDNLIHQDPNEASRFLHELSNLYRSVLKEGQETVIQIAKEIEMVSHFNFLMKSRFGENYHCMITLDEEVMENYFIPPLSLQMLLENVLKHNKIDDDNKLLCSIYQKDKYIMVENQKNLKSKVAESSGIGLKNLVSRYRHLSTKSILIIDDNTVFKIGIPMLTIEDSKALVI